MAVRIITVVCQKQVKAVRCCQSTVKHPGALVSVDVCVTLIPAKAVCILFTTSCKLFLT